MIKRKLPLRRIKGTVGGGGGNGEGGAGGSSFFTTEFPATGMSDYTSPTKTNYRRFVRRSVVYRLARLRARWYQLRGLPLVGPACVCPQCNSSIVVTRGSATPHRPWTFPSISHELTRNANSDNGTRGQLVSNHSMHGKTAA